MTHSNPLRSQPRPIPPTPQQPTHGFGLRGLVPESARIAGSNYDHSTKNSNPRPHPAVHPASRLANSWGPPGPRM
ncbi:hypothetical protein BHM03_00009175 [Ensete ventricosum]|nr:hypothetical protein BHM03_00009175 [Ensete ventricosum]